MTSSVPGRRESLMRRILIVEDSRTQAEHLRLLLRLHLARGWVRGVVGAYLYAKAQKEMQESHA